MIKNALLAILLLALVVTLSVSILLYSISEVDTEYEGSESKWRSYEMNFKGRDYVTVIRLFETYKIKCDKPELVLFRVTPDTELPFYRSIFQSPKWRIPYKEKNTASVGSYDYWGECMNKDLDTISKKKIESNISSYINAL